MTPVSWPTINYKRIGIVLNSSSWETPSGVIGDQTRSGKIKTRPNHIHAPKSFNITMHMTLDEYRVFKNWYENVCRKGARTFVYPIIDDNTGLLVEYQFTPDSSIGKKNTSALNLELTMSWMEA